MRHLILLLLAVVALVAVVQLMPSGYRTRIAGHFRRNALWLALAGLALLAIIVGSFYLPALPILK
ncbi:hypothetical protein [Lysobacter humi (ex Lee et al. 2017)]